MDTEWKKKAWEFIYNKTSLNLMRIGANFPHASVNKHYDLGNEQWWTAGFWPGILWKIYLSSNDEKFKITAETCEEKMEHLLNDSDLLDHDLGFMWTLSSLANYKITKNKQSRRRALLAANLLAARFNVNGNFIRAWNFCSGQGDCNGIAIIDCLMNLPILFWASEETGDPRFKHIAVKHATTVLKDFIRPDGSAQHLVVFDAETGKMLEKRAGQGFAPDSAWARGCSWAVYGFALCYKYTKIDEFLCAAKKTSDYFIAHMKGVKYPVWDFLAPQDGEKKNQYPDSSAAAIAACGLLLLSKFVSEKEALFYQETGERFLKDLYFSCGTMDDLEEGLLKHGTGNFPKQKELDVPLIYGDYFFTEGIAALNGDQLLFW